MSLYDAALDGIPLEIETLDDQFESSISRHEFPYKDGALLENMGQKARTITLRCYFWDSGSHFTYNNHIALVNHLRSKQLFELTHPQYGAIQGMIERISVRADDRDMAAEVDLTFIENLRQDISEVQYEDIESAADQAMVDIQEEQMAQLEDAGLAELGAEAQSLYDVILVEGQELLGQFTAISQKARAYVRRLDSTIAAFEGILTDVVAPANSLISTINFGTRLPGRVIGALARLTDRYVTLYSTAIDAPDRFMRNMQTASDNLIAQFNTDPDSQTQIRIAFSSQSAAALAKYYAADESQREILRRSGNKAAFSITGRYLSPPVAAKVFTLSQLETSLSVSRTLLQQAIDSSGGRSQTNLKSLALSLLNHVSTVKLEREKIITVNLDNPLPLQLVCFRYGLDYHYAERIITINSIPEPNFTQGSLQVYLPQGGQL